MSNEQTYTERLAALRRATQVALSDAQYVSNRPGECADDAATTAYTNLWADLLNALIAHADCDHAELLGIMAGVLQMRVPIVGVVEADGRVSWDNQNGNGGGRRE